MIETTLQLLAFEVLLPVFLATIIQVQTVSLRITGVLPAVAPHQSKLVVSFYDKTDLAKNRAIWLPT